MFMSTGIHPLFLAKLFRVGWEWYLTKAVFKGLVLQELHKVDSANSYMGSPGLVRWWLAGRADPKQLNACNVFLTISGC